MLSIYLQCVVGVFLKSKLVLWIQTFYLDIKIYRVLYVVDKAPTGCKGRSHDKWWHDNCLVKGSRRQSNRRAAKGASGPGGTSRIAKSENKHKEML